MKKLYYLIILTVILGLVLTGCLLSNVGQVPSSEQSGITYLTKGIETDPDVFTLYADQDIDVGTVSVWDDCVDLYVKYETTGGWVMTETHLAVVANFDDFPLTKKNNPKVGHFPYQCCYDETEEEWLFVKKPEDLVGTCDADGNDLLTEITYIISLGSDTELYIAAHASLLKLVDTVKVYANKLTPTDSNVPLESGKNYLLKASGTAFAGDYISFDAKYSNSKYNIPPELWTDDVAKYETYGPTLLGLAVDGVFVDWGLYNEDHIYYWNMDGIGSCVPLWIYDVCYPNNTGFLTVEIYQEESAWAGMDEGEILFPGKNWATYFTYHIAGVPPTISSEDLAGPFTAGVLEEFSVTTVNPDSPCGQEYLHVLFNFTIFDIDLLDIASFDAHWGGGWHDELLTMSQVGDDVTGYFGPQTGFPMSAPYNETTDFKITFDAAVTGTYTVEITLNDLDDGDAVLATFTEGVVVSSETGLAIGDTYGGGKVAYILQPGEFNGVYNYDANVQHGLIAAIADATTEMAWSNITSTSVGTTGTAIGTGQANTTLIVNQIVGTTHCTSGAAYYCANLTVGVYDDWFLPSKDELNKLWLNKVSIGGFAGNGYWYWSSSEYDAYNACYQSFGNYYQGCSNKNATYGVRAIRAF